MELSGGVRARVWVKKGVIEGRFACYLAPIGLVGAEGYSMRNHSRAEIYGLKPGEARLMGEATITPLKEGERERKGRAESPCVCVCARACARWEGEEWIRREGNRMRTRVGPVM